MRKWMLSDLVFEASHCKRRQGFSTARARSSNLKAATKAEADASTEHFDGKTTE
jgi:hypothetical protein